MQAEARLFERFLARYAPDLLGPSWQAWRACIGAILGAPPEDEAGADLIRACTQREPPTSPAREAWLVIGRRGGKSRTAAVLAAFLATCRNYAPVLSPGERGTVMLIAADRKQARVLTRYIRAVFHDHPELAALIAQETAESLELTTRVVIEVHTSSFRTVRGYTIVAALLDELAFWHTDEASASPDVEVVNAIRPAMATVPGALLLGLSSPYRRAGVLWSAYQQHFGKPGDVLVWQAATRTMNAGVPQALIDQAYLEDDASASAEYGAEFRRDLERYISREAVEAVTVKGRVALEPQADVTYAAFVDPSGGSADSFTLAIAHKDARGRAVLDLGGGAPRALQSRCGHGRVLRAAAALSRDERRRRSLRGPVAARPVRAPRHRVSPQ